TYTPPQQATYTPPSPPTYTPPSPPTYTPPQQATYTPPSPPTYTPPQQATYTPPQQATYTPPQQDTYTPPQSPFVPQSEFAPPPQPAFVPTPTPPAPTPEPVSSSAVQEEPAPVRPRGKGVTILLLLYAMIVTAAAIIGWLRTPPGHPFSIIPDVFGQYDAKGRTTIAAQLPDPTDTLPDELVTTLGQKLALGELDVTPLEIAERKVMQLTEFTGSSQPTRSQLPPCLMLKLKVENKSTNHAFHPVDPAFNRKAVLKEPAVVGLYPTAGRSFVGGPIAWPFGKGIQRVYLEGQENDDQPLQPGESREVVIPSLASRELVGAIHTAKQPVLWKVQLRRGQIPFGLHSVPVTALIGVKFDSQQVMWMNSQG
ncbi:MAG: hypothetical protein LC104_21180, partial [Bacteroidales bacterium]|nr:hypothetical protein [Bacteroidales bacterium]